MRTTTICKTAILLALSTVIAFAADVTGRWSGVSDQGPTFTFNLKSEKDVVTGTMKGNDEKEVPVTDGKLSGDDVSFVVNTEYEGNPIKLLVKGKLDSGSLKLHIETDDGGWSTDATLHKS